MKFCWCTIMVKNMAESLRFYQDILGLPLVRRFTAGPETEIVFLGDGETQVELIENKRHEEISFGPDLSLGFEIQSADAMIALLNERGIAVHSGPFQPNPHMTFFYILDPNGLKIQLVENR